MTATKTKRQAGRASQSLDSPPHSPELTLTRLFDAPRALVFKAWTEPAHLARWWGPKGFTNPVCEVDLRPGGEWRIHMRAPDGAIYPSRGRFLEVDPPRRLAMTDEFEIEPRPMEACTWTIEFEETNAMTSVTLQIRCQSEADRETMLKMGWEEGMSQSLDRLDGTLAAF